jgi:hypothetical protein
MFKDNVPMKQKPCKRPYGTLHNPLERKPSFWNPEKKEKVVLFSKMNRILLVCIGIVLKCVK